MVSKALFSSEKENWRTPPALFELLNSEFHFSLDPCADSENHKCELYFDEKKDGLKQSWANQTVFMNPPYGEKTPAWMKKAYMESHLNRITVVCLIAARVDTQMWHDWIFGCCKEIIFCNGRVHFEDEYGVIKKSPTFPNAIVIYDGKRKPTSRYKTINIRGLSNDKKEDE